MVLGLANPPPHFWGLNIRAPLWGATLQVTYLPVGTKNELQKKIQVFCFNLMLNMVYGAYIRACLVVEDFFHTNLNKDLKNLNIRLVFFGD